MPLPDLELTEGYLLNGRVRYAQPAGGFRSGIEPVLLAASVPARPGDAVLEAGSGAGAALLCVAARVGAISGLGVEQDPALVEIAARNAAANEWPELTFVTADIAALAEVGPFDHACANPPYHPAASTASPDARRDLSRRATPELFGVWAVAMGQLLRRRGTLTWIIAAASIPACVAAMEAAGCPAAALFPLWPRAREPAKLALIRGIKGGRGPFRVLPGLVLHADSAGFTPEADAVLREGQALAW